ncbi:YciI family protein [Kribbella sp. CA-247076]|uniref:YciI family protein n=1 Tax=Kribbella sp. CA-247076 TaxID=3239941 RepID=UPI003D937FAC
MNQYLLSIYQPDGPPPSEEFLEPIMRELRSLNAEMKTAGVWVFAAGLHPPETATVVKAGGGDVLVTDGPFTEGKEHLGGFTVIEVEDLDAALGWARRLAQVLSPLSIEVRPSVLSPDEPSCHA